MKIFLPLRSRFNVFWQGLLGLSGFLISLSWLTPLASQDIVFPPKPSHFQGVHDYANFLKNPDLQKLKRKLQNYKEKSSNQIVVVTVPTIEGHSIESYSLKLAKAWGIGSAQKDNGILLLLVRESRQVRIELGKGMRDLISQQDAQRIIDKTLSPTFRAKHYFEGLDWATNQLMALSTGGEYNRAWEHSSTTQDQYTSWVIFVAVGIFFIWYRIFFQVTWYRKDWQYLAVLLVVGLLSVITWLCHPLLSYWPKAYLAIYFIVFLLGIFVSHLGVSYLREKDWLIKTIYRRLKEYNDPDQGYVKWTYYAQFIPNQEYTEQAAAMEKKVQYPFWKPNTYLRDCMYELSNRMKDPDKYHGLKEEDLVKKVQEFLINEKKWANLSNSFGKKVVKSQRKLFEASFLSAQEFEAESKERTEALWALVKNHYVPIFTASSTYFKVKSKPNFTPKGSTYGRNSSKSSYSSGYDPSDYNSGFGSGGDSGGSFGGDGASGSW